MAGFEHNATAYTLRRAYANILYAKASAEDRRFLMGHKTNSEIYSHYHSAVSTVHIQEIFRDIRANNAAAEMHGLSLNRLQQLPQTISNEGWERMQQDPELVKYSLETSQINADLREMYGSTAAAIRACDHRIESLVAATARLKNRRRALIGAIYQEEYRMAFVGHAPPQTTTSSTLRTTIHHHHSEPESIMPADTTLVDARNWMLEVEQDEEAAKELGDDETIDAVHSHGHEIDTEGLDPNRIWTDDDVEMYGNPPAAGLPPHLSEGSETIRLHKINDGSALPKNMTITRVREAMSSGCLTDAALSHLMVEAFSATHRSGKYIPGEEPLLGTSTCRFSGVDLSSDWHSPETAHAAHSREVQNAAKEAFEEHLLPLDMPCKYHSQGPTKKKNPRLCGFARFKTRYEQVCHVSAHTLTLHKQHHAVGNIPHGEWHCYYDGCAILTTPTNSDTRHVPRVTLSTSSIFSSEQTYLRHFYQEHRLSPRAVEPVLWCGICEHFLEWEQFGTGKDDHFDTHWEEVWSLVAEHGYAGQFDNGRRTIPSFCPFCLHNENISPAERISTTMSLLDRKAYASHIAGHFDDLDYDSTCTCPCFPKTCIYQQEMTPPELASHLSNVHGIERSQLSRKEARKEARALSEKSVNVQEGLERAKSSKRAKK